MTATLYHRSGGGWTRTVLPDVWYRVSRGSARSPGFGRDDQAASLLLIPFQQGLAIDPEDGVFPGTGPEIGAGALKAELPEAQIVTEVHLHRPGSPLDHWEVYCR